MHEPTKRRGGPGRPRIPREQIVCACGCGTLMADRNKHGRKVQCVRNHHANRRGDWPKGLRRDGVRGKARRSQTAEHQARREQTARRPAQAGSVEVRQASFPPSSFIDNAEHPAIVIREPAARSRSFRHEVGALDRQAGSGHPDRYNLFVRL